MIDSTKTVKISKESENGWLDASDQKEIFKISDSISEDNNSYLGEIRKFDAKKDKIFLPKIAKQKNLEIHLTEFQPGTYRFFPYKEDDKWSLITRANLSLSSKKHPTAKDNPYTKNFIEIAKKNHNEALQKLFNSGYEQGIFVTYSEGGWNAYGGMTEADVTERYLKSIEEFGMIDDIAYYLDDDRYQEVLSVIQGHPKAISRVAFEEENPKETEDFNALGQNTPSTLEAYYAYEPIKLIQIEAVNTLSLEEVIRSIYYHDGKPAWNDKKEKNPMRSTIYKTSKFNRKSADKITNFNPSTESLEIDTVSFGIDSSATFAAGKNRKVVKNKLAKLDIDFLYDEKKGGLYFNENSADKGFGDGGIIAILKGAPDLTSGNLEFI